MYRKAIDSKPVNVVRLFAQRSPKGFSAAIAIQWVIVAILATASIYSLLTGRAIQVLILLAGMYAMIRGVRSWTGIRRELHQ